MFKAPKQRKRQFRRDSVNVRIFGTTPARRNVKARRKNCQNWSKAFLLKVATAAYKRAVQDDEIPGEFDGDKTARGTYGKVIIPRE